MASAVTDMHQGFAAAIAVRVPGQKNQRLDGFSGQA
jgi:hypothetical protein